MLQLDEILLIRNINDISAPKGVDIDLTWRPML